MQVDESRFNDLSNPRISYVAKRSIFRTSANKSAIASCTPCRLRQILPKPKSLKSIPILSSSQRLASKEDLGIDELVQGQVEFLPGIR